MASNESWEMLERWKAEHPDLSAGGGRTPPEPRPRLVAAPGPSPVSSSATEQLEMIERWRREHPTVASRPAAARQAPSRAERPPESEARVLAFADAPLSVLSAFIVGAIIGGIVMTIVTGIAFWGFAGG